MKKGIFTFRKIRAEGKEIPEFIWNKSNPISVQIIPNDDTYNVLVVKYNINGTKVDTHVIHEVDNVEPEKIPEELYDAFSNYIPFVDLIWFDYGIGIHNRFDIIDYVKQHKNIMADKTIVKEANYCNKGYYVSEYVYSCKLDRVEKFVWYLKNYHYSCLKKDKVQFFTVGAKILDYETDCNHRVRPSITYNDICELSKFLDEVFKLSMKCKEFDRWDCMC